MTAAKTDIDIEALRAAWGNLVRTAARVWDQLKASLGPLATIFTTYDRQVQHGPWNFTDDGLWQSDNCASWVHDACALPRHCDCICHGGTLR